MDASNVVEVPYKDASLQRPLYSPSSAWRDNDTVPMPIKIAYPLYTILVFIVLNIAFRTVAQPSE